MSADSAKLAFQEAHQHWVHHADADGSQYIYDSGTEVELNGLESKTEYNGLVGVVNSYLPERGRFRVEGIGGAGGAAANVRPANLVGLSSPPVPLSSLEAVRIAFFRPGMRYYGSIQIPGDAGYRSGDVIGQRQTYELTIVGDLRSCIPELSALSEEMEKVLGPVICARHRAYEDEQFVLITMVDINEAATAEQVAAGAVPTTLTMRYSDAETSCSGTWDPVVGAFKGNVSQKVHSSEKIFVKADPVTHTFDLYPCHHAAPHEALCQCTKLDSTDCVARCRHRVTTTKALEHCVKRFQQVVPLVNTNTLPDMGEFTAFIQGEVRWKTLLEAASLLAEKTCAYIRVMADFLDALEFNCPLSRLHQLEVLEIKGVSRARVHEICDKSFLLVAHTLTWWFRLHPNQIADAATMHVARYRLDKSYEQFSNALSSASVRLTDSTIDSFARAAVVALGKEGDLGSSTPTDGRFAEDTCSICMDGFCGDGSFGDVALVLPCSHFFHRQCIRSWLRFHAQCPMCRTVLKE